ncbi:12071_t:CDS:2, partial [Dentiscutata erythropus]
LVNINKRLLQINEQYDVIIRVSKDIDFKNIYAHSQILCARSSYFKTALSNIKKDEKDERPFIFPIQDISTIVFEVILSNFVETSLRKLNGGEVLKLMMINELKIQNAINDILSKNDIVEAILAKLNGAQVLEIIEKSEELIIQKAIANILSNKTFINNILHKFNSNNILNLLRMPNNMKSRKTIDDLLISDDFVKIILDKLNIEQFLQFMNIATKLQNEIIVNNLFSNANFILIVIKFQGVEILHILVEANRLQLQNLFSDMLTFIEQNLENLLRIDAVGVLEMVFKHDICISFREYSIYLICLNPNALFDNPNFIQLNRSILNHILERDDMGKLNEKNIYDHLIRWGAAQNEETSRKNIMTWTDQEFEIFEEVIHDFVRLIRWFTIPSEDFNKIRSLLNNVLPDNLYQNIVDYHLDPNLSSEEMRSYSQKRFLPCTFLLKPRHFKIFESWIEEANQKNISIIQKLFNLNTTNEKKNHFKEITLNTRPTHFSKNNLYDFILLYRGKKNGFNAKKFHDSCDNKGSTLTIIKTSDQRIFGGYNDSNTENHYIERTVSRKNFLFSFDSQNDFSTSKLARVKKNSWVSEYQSDYGPCFGCNKNNFDMYIDSKHLHIPNSNIYPNLKNFISLNSNLLIDDYEVWHVSKKRIHNCAA